MLVRELRVASPRPFRCMARGHPCYNGTISFPQEPVSGVPLLRVLHGADKIDLCWYNLGPREARRLTATGCPFRSLRCDARGKATLMVLASVKPLRQLTLTYPDGLTANHPDIETFTRARPEVTVVEEFYACVW